MALTLGDTGLEQVTNHLDDYGYDTTIARSGLSIPNHPPCARPTPADGLALDHWNHSLLHTLSSAAGWATALPYCTVGAETVHLYRLYRQGDNADPIALPC